jgi:hypothetical protein
MARRRAGVVRHPPSVRLAVAYSRWWEPDGEPDALVFRNGWGKVKSRSPEVRDPAPTP